MKVHSSKFWWSPIWEATKGSSSFRRFTFPNSHTFEERIKRSLVANNGSFHYVTNEDEPMVPVGAAAASLHEDVVTVHFFWFDESKIKKNLGVLKKLFLSINNYYPGKEINFVNFPVPSDRVPEGFHSYAKPVKDRYGRRLVWFKFSIIDFMSVI